MRRSPIRSRRATPRRREAPRWSAAEWGEANAVLYARSGGCCEMCGKPLAGQAERAHRVRRRDGGDRLSNVLLLHPACHAWTHAHPTEAMERGYILHTSEDPPQSAVLWLGRRWVTLTDDGTVEYLP